MSTKNNKILHQIQQLSDRIFELNDRIDLTILNSGEVKKIERAKSKLVKKKDKLYKKLCEESCESNIYN